MQLRVWHIARSALSNWFATAATLVVGFFLSPYVVHRLGIVAYGVWVLAMSSINYMVMLDLGMASSVLRYVSKGYTTQDHEGASEVLSAVLWVRLQISALILLVGGILAIGFPHIFPVPQRLALDAREAMLIISLTTAISMSLGVFNSTLSALNRYDLRSYITLTQLCVRVVSVVYVLHTGHGIVAIALCELAAATVGNVLLVVVARNAYPQLTIRLAKPRREVIRKIRSYSVYAFLVTVAVQLVYLTDNLVVGAVISATAVTFYSIGNQLCRYTDQIVASITSTFTSAASSYEASGNNAGLRALYINGTRAAMLLSLPIVVTLIVRGKSFIGLWMGPQFARTSGNVLSILAVALMFAQQNTTAGAIAFGTEKHKLLAKWSIGEGIANLLLSIILARHIGIYGVAIGTLIPSLVIHLGFWPYYIRKLVDISYTQIIRNIWGPVLCAIPFAAASYAVNSIFPPHYMAVFIFQTLALLFVFLITVVTVFRDNFKRQIFPKLKTYLSARTR